MLVQCAPSTHPFLSLPTSSPTPNPPALCDESSPHGRGTEAEAAAWLAATHLAGIAPSPVLIDTYSARLRDSTCVHCHEPSPRGRRWHSKKTPPHVHSAVAQTFDPIDPGCTHTPMDCHTQATEPPPRSTSIALFAGRGNEEAPTARGNMSHPKKEPLESEWF